MTVKRKGYSGPITVTVADPPAGLTVRPGYDRRRPDRRRAVAVRGRRRQVPRGSDQARRPRRRGSTARSNGSRPSRWSTPSSRPLPTCSITEYGLVAAPALGARRSRSTHPPAPIEVAHGFGATIPVKVVRDQGIRRCTGDLRAPLPPGLTIARRRSPTRRPRARSRVKRPLAAPLGTMTVGLQAKGKIAGADQTFALPAVTLSVVRPATRRAGRAGARDQAGSDGRAQGQDRPQGDLQRAGDRQDQRPARRPQGRAGDGRRRCRRTSSSRSSPTPRPPRRRPAAQVAMAFQIEKKDYPVPPAPLAVKVLPAK